MKRGPRIDIAIPHNLNLTEFYLEENVPRGRGERTAVYCGSRQYSFNELCDLTNKVGNFLKQVGVGFGDRVLLILRDSPEWLACWFATMKIGAVATHAYTHLPPADYSYFLDYVQPRAIVVDRETLANVRSAMRQSGAAVALIVAGDDLPALLAGEHALGASLAGASPMLKAERANRSNVAFWNFSGGTTGKPKAVPHTHDHGVIGCESFQYFVHYTPDDSVLRVPKLFFHYARDLGMNWPLRAGAAVCLCPERSTPETIFGLIAEHRPTVLLNVPTMMRAMLRCPEAKTADLSCLRVCISSGEQLSAQLYREFTDTFGVEVINAHGSAESYLGYLISRPGEVRPGSTGRVAPLVDVKILDVQCKEVPPGETGVLWVRSAASGQGYYGDREESASTFLGDNWINTKDLFREDADGYFWFMGRASDVIKVGGIYVAPLEVEQCLEQHPAIKECVVLGVRDADDLLKTKAFVVLKPEFEATDRMAGELQAYCKHNLAGYKAPKIIEFMAELPKTGQGKIDKRQLLARDAVPAHGNVHALAAL